MSDRILRFFLLSSTLAMGVLAFVRVPIDPETVVLEAEGFVEIIEPMALRRNDNLASGGAYIALASGVGQGWRGLGEGAVTYRINIYRPGSYFLWGRCKWLDGCTNAFFLSANRKAPIVFGNDPIYGEWHWVKSAPIDLALGANHLTFSNHSDGTALDKIIITEDPLYIPEGFGKEITRFLDGFAGCDADNTGSWNFIKGNWKVVRSVGDFAAGANDVLAQWDPSGGVAIGGHWKWANYDLKASLMMNMYGECGLIFYRQDETSSWRIRLDNQEGTCYLAVLRISDSITEIIQEVSVAPIALDQWFELGFILHSDELIVRLDGVSILKCPKPTSRVGEIGIFTKGQSGIYFDNVEANFLDNENAPSRT